MERATDAKAALVGQGRKHSDEQRPGEAAVTDEEEKPPAMQLLAFDGRTCHKHFQSEPSVRPEGPLLIQRALASSRTRHGLTTN